MGNYSSKHVNRENSEAENVETTKPNPLENYLVLDYIFNLCSVTSLKQCRLVSKLWHESCQRAWNVSAQVQFYGYGRRMEKYMDFIEKENNFHVPFTSYSIPENSQRFWRLCGPSISQLELRSVELRNVNEYRFIAFGACPNMKSLSLYSVTVLSVKETPNSSKPRFQVNVNLNTLCVRSQSRDVGVTWSEFLAHFPFIQAITIGARTFRSDELYGTIVLMRQSNQNHMQLNRMKALADDVDSKRPNFSRDLFDLLVNTNLKLKSLSLSMECDNGEDILKAVLTAQRSTLKYLELIRYAVTPLNPITSFPSAEFGKLEELQELSLDAQVFASYAFLKFMPNLQRLSNFSGVCRELEGVNLVEAIDVKMDKCKTLIVGFTNEAKTLSNLMKWFPNVEYLNIFANNDAFRLICKQWPNLTNLSVDFDRLDDCGITGLDFEDVERINTDGKCGSWYPITVPRANITSLKHLRRFAARKQGLMKCFIRDFGYCAATHGIQKLPNLSQLRIECRRNNEIWNDLHFQYPWERYY